MGVRCGSGGHCELPSLSEFLVGSGLQGHCVCLCKLGSFRAEVKLESAPIPLAKLSMPLWQSHLGGDI